MLAKRRAGPGRSRRTSWIRCTPMPYGGLEVTDLQLKSRWNSCAPSATVIGKSQVHGEVILHAPGQDRR